MPDTVTILIIGTADTKADELLFLRDCVRRQQAAARVMDVGVLEGAPFAPDHANHEVAAAAGTTLAAIAASGDENSAMTAMARGAAALARRLHEAGDIDGVLVLGGTMGTDLALDVAAALPLGVPKMIVSTVAFSHLLPPERIAPDLMMTLWAGGLYGLNSICRSSLAQAAGAVVGACRARALAPPGSLSSARPMVAITSLGKSCLRYMVPLKPALEARGYEVAVFHCTGMGGRAFEAMCAERRFAAVLDLCAAEVGNEINGSVVTAGRGRLTAGGRAGLPQIGAPGGADMIDFQTWKPLPPQYGDRPYHAHNRLIASVTMTADERRALAREYAARLAQARGPAAFVMPLRGIQQWDQPGEPLHDPATLAAFSDELRRAFTPPLQLVEVDAHINDAAFADAVLAQFDAWVADGRIASGRPAAVAAGRHDAA